MAGHNHSETTGLSHLKGLLDPLPFKGKGVDEPMDAIQVLKLRQVVQKRLDDTRAAMKQLRESFNRQYRSLPWSLTVKRTGRAHWIVAWRERGDVGSHISLHSPETLPKLLALPDHTRVMICDVDRQCAQMAAQSSIDNYTLIRLDCYLDRVKIMGYVKSGLYEEHEQLRPKN